MLIVTASIIGALIVIAVTILALQGPAARRSLRIAPSVRTRAPLGWRWLPTRPAGLHRRLREAAAAARHTGQRDDLRGWLPTGYATAVRDVELEALRVEANLVHAARGLGSVRRRRLANIERRVAELEARVNQLVASTADWSVFLGVRHAQDAVVIDLTEASTATGAADSDSPTRSAV